MYIRSISPIIATILIIVMTVAIAGIFYAFTSGLFGSLTQSSSQQIQQQSQIISFTINNVYCSNNILYFNIYNKGNIPININNSLIIFTDNYGNAISINGSNIICNNGNIINIGSSELCWIINNYFCYYSYIDYIKSTNFVYNGISYSYSISNSNFILVPIINTIDIYNSQNIPTPSSFQQDIAICNGNPNVNNSFSYVDDPALFSAVDSNGQNVYFTTTYNSNPNIYSWYEGQENLNGVTCDVWWLNLPNIIPANSNITIYMYVGNSSANYYQQYYPYVGEAPQLSPTYAEYDNGNYVFNYYWNFNGTTLPSGFTSSNFCGSSNTGTVTVNNGLTYSAGSNYCQVLYYSASTFSPPIVFETYAEGTSIGSVYAFASEVGAGISNGTSFYGTNFWLSRIDYGSNPYNIWNYWISSSATNTNDQMALNTFYVFGVASSGSSSMVYAYGSGVFYYVTSTSTFPSSFYILPVDIDGDEVQVVYWTRIRAYPPNGIMPSIYIS